VGKYQQDCVKDTGNSALDKAKENPINIAAKGPQKC